MSLDQDRLGKILNLARNGSSGEKENAIRIVKRLCAKHGLDFDEVMKDREDTLEKFYIKPKRTHRKLVVHIILRYGFPEGVPRDVYRNGLGEQSFTTTKEKYIEVLNAISILCPLYDKELAKTKEAVYFGFLGKHELFWTPREDEEDNSKKKLSKKEEELRRRGALLSMDMEDAEILKRLESPKV